MLKRLEHALESILFSSRWILAPFFLGLVLAIFLLLAKFLAVLFGLFAHAWVLSGSQILVGVLTLVDVTLMANLLVIIVLAGYESSVSRMDHADHKDRLVWMGQVGFSDLKLKVIGSIVAISAIELLRLFLSMETVNVQLLTWKLAIHAAFVLSGVLFALMDKLATRHQ